MGRLKTLNRVLGLSLIAMGFNLMVPLYVSAAPCAIVVTAPSVEVVDLDCLGQDSWEEDSFIGYAHAGEVYIAVSKYNKWLRIAFNGKEGWVPAYGAGSALLKWTI